MSADAVGRGPKRGNGSGSGSGPRLKLEVEIRGSIARGSRDHPLAGDLWIGGSWCVSEWVAVAAAYYTGMATDRSRAVKRGRDAA